MDRRAHDDAQQIDQGDNVAESIQEIGPCNIVKQFLHIDEECLFLLHQTFRSDSIAFLYYNRRRGVDVISSLALLTS